MGKTKAKIIFWSPKASKPVGGEERKEQGEEEEEEEEEEEGQTKAWERRPRVGTGATSTSLVETLDGE